MGVVGSTRLALAFRAAFINSLTSVKKAEDLIREIELKSALGKDNVKPENAFVIGKKEGNILMLYSTEYIMAHPKGKIIPSVEITVNDAGEGSEIGYKIDIQPNFFSVFTVLFLAFICCAGFVWLVCSLFTSFNILGIFGGAVLTVVPIVLFVKGPVQYWRIMMDNLKSIAMPAK